MTNIDVFQHLISQSAKVYWRGPDAAMILCKAHGERRKPALSVRPGDEGILVFCFAGSSLQQVCRAFSVEVCQLFYDYGHSRHRGQRPTLRPTYRLRSWKERAADLQDEAMDHWLRAERILAAAKNQDVSNWTELQSDIAMTLLGVAYDDLALAEQLEDKTFIRYSSLAQRSQRYT